MKATESVRTIIEEWMRKNNDRTAKELQKLLKDFGHKLSKRTVLNCNVGARLAGLTTEEHTANLCEKPMRLSDWHVCVQSCTTHSKT